jgi:hypothetical protein
MTFTLEDIFASHTLTELENKTLYSVDEIKVRKSAYIFFIKFISLCLSKYLPSTLGMQIKSAQLPGNSKKVGLGTADLCLYSCSIDRYQNSLNVNCV